MPQGIGVLEILDICHGQVETVVDLEIIVYIIQVKAAQFTLGIAQRKVERRCLQHFFRMRRGETQSPATVNNIFSKPDGDFRHTFLREFVVNRVIVERTPYTGKRREIKTVVGLTYDFLYDNRHLLLVDYIRCGGHICFALGIEHRCIHPFYGITQQFVHLLRLIHMRNHISGIHPGKRLVMRVFQKARTPHRQGTVNNLGECFEIVDNAFGQPRLEKRRQNLLVRKIAQSDGVKVVVGHEIIKDVGTQHHCARYRNRNPVEVVAFGMLFDDRIDKRQATPFAAEGTLAYTCEIGIVVEPVLTELRHHPAVLHLAVFDDKVEKKPFNCRGFLNGIETMEFHYIGNGEHGP